MTASRQIIEYFSCPDRARWLEAIGRCDWRGGQYLAELLRGDRLRAVYGAETKLLLLTEGGELASFCTYAPQDDIPDPSLGPWAGFVYTFPAWRGRRRMGKLLERAHALAKADGKPCLYIATDETGLYEKYGCVYWQDMRDRRGGLSRVYRLPVERRDYGGILGRRVSGTVDRPLGSAHPRHPDLVYPVNYGYADGVMAADGAEQDVYILGPDRPLSRFSGTVVAVWHRLNDVEDKWIVTPDGTRPPDETIAAAIDFQERYFMGELYR